MSYLKGPSSESAARRRWWMIYVPEIDELTQACQVSETEDMTPHPPRFDSAHTRRLRADGAGQLKHGLDGAA
jgi:hypothetical protein